MNYTEELETAFEAAEKAGEIIDRYIGQDLRHDSGTNTKENINDLVTEADRKSQKKIVGTIERNFPEDYIAGEEGETEENSSRREWIIDPVDGTANFSTGFPYYCVSIALRVKGEIKMGLVYSPKTSLEKIWYAVQDQGTYTNDELKPEGEKVRVSDHEKLEGATVFSRLSERSDERREVEKPIVMELLDQGIRYRRTASAAINLALVAEGKVDGLGYTALGEYDIAAGKILVEEAGGETRIRDSNYNNRFEIIATNGEIQENIQNIFDNHVP